MSTKKQLAALKYLITKSKHGNDAGKRLYWYLIDRSAGLTKEVCVTLTEGKEGYSTKEIQELARSLDGMTSSNGTTHLDAIMNAIGSNFSFNFHYGHFDRNGKFDTSGMFAGASVGLVLDPKLARLNVPLSYTFWLAPGFYSGSAKRIKVTRQKLETIDLSKPGLYPSIENQRRAG